VKNPFLLGAFCLTYTIIGFSFATPSRAQLTSPPERRPDSAGNGPQPYLAVNGSHSSAAILPATSLPDPPDPPEPSPAAAREHPNVETAETENWGPLSRIGVGADVSTLGIGIKGAVILTKYFDARLDTNFFLHDTGLIKISGVNVDADFHFVSMATKLDWYPGNSIWRLSPGIMFVNANRLSGTVDITGGNSFDVNGKTYYSANPNPVTGATPFTGNVVLGLNTDKPAFTVSGGWGRFVPHSHRRWSFPSEFGVIFMGAPNLNVNMSGWVCTDRKQTQCSDLGNPTNPIAIQFNNNLQTQLTKWRRDLGAVSIYPIFSYSFMYSFDSPW
jgi:hypothetical protein